MMNSATASVRLRMENDLSSCVALLMVVHARDGYPTTWPADARAWLTPSGILQAWVALRDTAIIGHVVVGVVDEKRILTS